MSISQVLGEVLSSDLLLRGAGGAAFVLYRADTWRTHHYLGWVAAILLGLELLAALVFLFGRSWKAPSIPVRGKHLDALEPLDIAFIVFNKSATCLFTYHLLRFLCYSDTPTEIAWKTSDLSLVNTLIALPLLYIVYDFFYTLFHRALHHRSVYKYIHKHHHRQKAPSRGNNDAVNVHPFEFLSGEYNHMLVIYLVSRYMVPVHAAIVLTFFILGGSFLASLNHSFIYLSTNHHREYNHMLAIYLVSRYMVPVHAATVLTFIVLGGFLASLNHTRFAVKAPIFESLYQVKYHDIHHWFPESNYGQYIMLWDHVFNSFKPYPKEKTEKHAATFHTDVAADDSEDVKQATRRSRKAAAR